MESGLNLVAWIIGALFTVGIAFVLLLFLFLAGLWVWAAISGAFHGIRAGIGHAIPARVRQLPASVQLLVAFCIWVAIWYVSYAILALIRR